MADVSFQGKSNLFISGDIYNQFVQKSENTRRVITKAFADNSLSINKPFLTMPEPDDLVVIVRNEREGFMKKFPVLAQIEKVADDICRKKFYATVPILIHPFWQVLNLKPLMVSAFREMSVKQI